MLSGLCLLPAAVCSPASPAALHRAPGGVTAAPAGPPPPPAPHGAPSSPTFGAAISKTERTHLWRRKLELKRALKHLAADGIVKWGP